jgi:hypothetical protein
MGSAETRRLHAVVFDDPDKALLAVRGFRSAGYTIEDVHTPFPVHGMVEAMGLRETRLAYGPLVGGIVGLTIAICLQTWTHAVSWPLNVGGKSMTAIPAIVPVSFEMTVLLAGLATFATLLVAARLWPRGRSPASQPHLRASDDRFVVVVVERDGSFVAARFAAMCVDAGSIEVISPWRVT